MNISLDKIWCVIPVYNNGKTLKRVVTGCKRYLDNILVVDDGSNDIDVSSELSDIGSVVVLKHKRNMGKGYAIKTALKYLADISAVHMITIDADGQHFPEDLEVFIGELKNLNHTILIGCRDFDSLNIPNSSRFGRNFSNMWIRLETGLSLKDTQSGFRSYPVQYLNRINLFSNRYNFEIESLVKASWAGIKVRDIPVRVYYSKNNRVSHFRPIADNFRISLMHTYLIILRLLPIPFRKLVKDDNKLEWKQLLHPIKLLKLLVKEHSSPKELGLAAAVGTFLAVLPLVGFHSVAIIYASVRLKLNKIMAFNVQHIFMPPFTPILCIELGHYLLNGKLLTEVTFQTLCMQLPQRLLEWLLGSIILAPTFAVITGFLVFIICKVIKSKIPDNKQRSNLEN